MLIQVSYATEEGEKFDYVKDFVLDQLIDSGKIARFRRSSGWVTIGVDPIRDRGANAGFHGEERRSGRA
jgi:hypothetical protein